MEKLLPLGAPPSYPGVLPLQLRLCPLAGSRSDPKDHPATGPHPAGHGLDGFR